jgi:WD40 repeat protein
MTLGSREPQLLAAHRGALSPAGDLLIVQDGLDLLAVEVATARTRHRLTGHRAVPVALAFSGDDRQLASAEPNGVVHLWDLERGREHSRIETGTPGPGGGLLTPALGPPPCLALSPDGRWLALWDLAAGRLGLWEAATGKPCRHWDVEEAEVGCLAFSPDGRLLGSGDGSRGQVSLWRTTTGERCGRLEAVRDHPPAFAFAPDGKSLAVAAPDSTVMLWRTPPSPDCHKLSSSALAELWVRLGDEDGAAALRCVGDLVAAPKSAVPFLRERLSLQAGPGQVAKLLKDLDSDRFAVRAVAERSLRDLGGPVAPALHAALSRQPTIEVRRRLEKLLAELDGPGASERLRAVRALAVLEQAGTPEARQALAEVAQTEPGSWRGREAQAALRRLALRYAAP